MRCIAPIEVVSKTEQSSEKYLQELPIKGFVLEAVPLSSFEHKTDEPYAGRANKRLFTKPPYPLANETSGILLSMFDCQSVHGDTYYFKRLVSEYFPGS